MEAVLYVLLHRNLHTTDIDGCNFFKGNDFVKYSAADADCMVTFCVYAAASVCQADDPAVSQLNKAGHIEFQPFLFMLVR